MEWGHGNDGDGHNEDENEDEDVETKNDLCDDHEVCCQMRVDIR